LKNYSSQISRIQGYTYNYGIAIVWYIVQLTLTLWVPKRTWIASTSLYLQLAPVRVYGSSPFTHALGFTLTLWTPLTASTNLY